MAKDLWKIEADGRFMGIFSSKLKAINEIKNWLGKPRVRNFEIITDLNRIDKKDDRYELICVRINDPGKSPRFANLYVSRVLYNNGASLVTIRGKHVFAKGR